jgi:murein DD-endopeptidase MepM/ murein hydrolase activator NlpD
MIRPLVRTSIALLLVATLALALPGAAPASKRKSYKFGARALSAGAVGKDVRRLQRSLGSLGFATPINGVFGKPTRQAVKALERRQRWPVNGVVSRGEARRILKLLRAAKVHVFYLQGLVNPSVTVTALRAGSSQLDVIDTATGAPIASLPLSFADATPQTVSWNGIGAAGSHMPDGTYQFQLGDTGSAGARISGGLVKPFLLRAYAFPAPKKHSFGGAGARFGAPRGGHSHQGQDVIAACGLPILAAQGGSVSVNAYQAGGAGYYVVVHGISGTDTVYMHLKRPSWTTPGQTVYSGQQIGRIGSTGSSSGCHLHFEHWTYPGWYLGGLPYDPLAELTYWDSYS